MSNREKRMTKLLLWLADAGFFRYAGHPSGAPRWCPMGRVLYRDGGLSVLMPLGNCADYARMFGGSVEYLPRKRGGK